MIKDIEVERWVHAEFKQMLPALIWQNDDGEYEAFGKYRIVPQNPGYCVYINDDEQGFFNSTRTAISWCVADKYKRYNLARDLLTYDNRLVYQVATPSTKSISECKIITSLGDTRFHNL